MPNWRNLKTREDRGRYESLEKPIKDTTWEILSTEQTQRIDRNFLGSHSHMYSYKKKYSCKVLLWLLHGSLCLNSGNRTIEHRDQIAIYNFNGSLNRQGNQ